MPISIHLNTFPILNGLQMLALPHHRDEAFVGGRKKKCLHGRKYGKLVFLDLHVLFRLGYRHLLGLQVFFFPCSCYCGVIPKVCISLVLIGKLQVL